MAASLPPPVGDQLTPIQALIAGVQRPAETAAEQALVISVCIFIRGFIYAKGNDMCKR